MVSKELNVFWLGVAGASMVAVLPDMLGFQLAARSLHAGKIWLNSSPVRAAMAAAMTTPCKRRFFKLERQSTVLPHQEHQAPTSVLTADVYAFTSHVFTGYHDAVPEAQHGVRPTCSGKWLLHVLSLGVAQAGCGGRVAQVAALPCTGCWACGECC